MFCLELWTLIENVFFIWQGPRGKPGPSGPPGPPGDRVSPQAQSCHALHCINTSRYLLSFCVLYICVFVCFLSGFHREARHGGTTGPSRHVCKWFFTAYTWCMRNPHYMDSILHQCPLTHSKLAKCTCLTADKKCWCCCILKISNMQHVWLVTASCVTKEAPENAKTKEMILLLISKFLHRDLLQSYKVAKSLSDNVVSSTNCSSTNHKIKHTTCTNNTFNNKTNF